MDRRRLDNLMILQIIISISVIGISGYCLVTGNFNLLPLSLVFLSVMFIIIGLREYKRTKKLWWSLSFLGVALFVLFSAVLNIL